MGFIFLDEKYYFKCIKELFLKILKDVNFSKIIFLKVSNVNFEKKIRSQKHKFYENLTNVDIKDVLFLKNIYLFSRFHRGFFKYFCNGEYLKKICFFMESTGVFF